MNIRPDPFDGSSEKLRVKTTLAGGHYVHNAFNRANGPMADTHDRAVRLWNEAARPKDIENLLGRIAELDDEIEALKEQLEKAQRDLSWYAQKDALG